MTSGAKTSGLERPPTVRRLLLLLPAMLALPAPAQGFDLAALMAMLAQRRAGEAAFHEQRTVQGFEAPLVSTGTLAFEAPDRFVRQTLKPRPETLAVDGNRVTITRAGRSRSFSLDAAPEMVALIEAVRSTLTGNAATLQRHFEIALSGSAAQWTLRLTPLESQLAAQVRTVRIDGQRADLTSIEMELPGGDRSTMSIAPLRATAPAAPASRP